MRGDIAACACIVVVACLLALLVPAFIGLR
jgi:hypothetical protein